jgi:hypothetical protein
METVPAGIGTRGINLHSMVAIDCADRTYTLCIAVQAGKAFLTFCCCLPDMFIYGKTHFLTTSLQPVIPAVTYVLLYGQCPHFLQKFLACQKSAIGNRA